MKRTAAAALFLGLACSAHALWSVSDTGTWPDNWPAELEPLREQSGSMQGGAIDLASHHLPFTTRAGFEAAWPHLLKVKSKGAPIVLVRSPNPHWHFGETRAGVLVHCPPGPQDPTQAVEPVRGVDNLRERWLLATYLELVVDGDIVDLNRVPLPANTPIIDQRFDPATPKP